MDTFPFHKSIFFWEFDMGYLVFLRATLSLLGAFSTIAQISWVPTSVESQYTCLCRCFHFAVSHFALWNILSMNNTVYCVLNTRFLRRFDFFVVILDRSEMIPQKYLLGDVQHSSTWCFKWIMHAILQLFYFLQYRWVKWRLRLKNHYELRAMGFPPYLPGNWLNIHWSPRSMYLSLSVCVSDRYTFLHCCKYIYVSTFSQSRCFIKHVSQITNWNFILVGKQYAPKTIFNLFIYLLLKRNYTRKNRLSRCRLSHLF